MTKEINVNFGSQIGKIPIKNFKLDMISSHATILVIAKRGSGKTVVVKAILKHLNNIPVGTIISKTDRMNHDYSSSFPSCFIHNEFKPDILKKILIRQQIMLHKLEQKNAEGKTFDARAIVVMDDCLSDKTKWIKDKNIFELLFNGRHYHLTFILTMQYPLGITPDLRTNFDYVFLLADDNINNLKKIFEHYAGCFPNFDSFRQVYKQLTEDYGVMVLINKGARASLSEKIMYYHVENPDVDLDFGSKQFNNFHISNYNPHKSPFPDLDINMEEYLQEKKKNKEKIVVDKKTKK